MSILLEFAQPHWGLFLLDSFSSTGARGGVGIPTYGVGAGGFPGYGVGAGAGFGGILPP